jgi:hypothetical protein
MALLLGAWRWCRSSGRMRCQTATIGNIFVARKTDSLGNQTLLRMVVLYGDGSASDSTKPGGGGL